MSPIYIKFILGKDYKRAALLLEDVMSAGVYTACEMRTTARKHLRDALDEDFVPRRKPKYEVYDETAHAITQEEIMDMWSEDLCFIKLQILS